MVGVTIWKSRIKRLKDKANVPAAEYRQLALVHGKNVLTVDQHLAGRGRVQRADHVQQRTFAGTGFPHDGHIFPLGNGKTDILQSLDCGFSAAIGLTNVFDL